MRDHLRGKKLRMITAISKASGAVIPIGDMKYSGYNIKDRTRIFSIIMPITGLTQDFAVPDKHYIAKVLPQGLVDLIDYYDQTRGFMQRARDLRPLNGDLAPICEQECKEFGVREMQPNRCIPRVKFLDYKLSSEQFEEAVNLLLSRGKASTC